METAIFIARVFGICYLIMGIGILFNRKTFEKVIEDYCKNSALLLFGGIFALVIGLVIILKHNIWVSNWTVIITLIGWAAFIKGIWIILFPNMVPIFMETYKKNNILPIVHSITVLILGTVLTYFGYFLR